MGSSGECGNNGIDATVGSLVWVRRRNGSWWPGRIVGVDELSEDFVVSPKSGTPVKLLGRDDASVDWYNLEKSKRVKPFRCGEYDTCIEKAKAAAANPNKKAVKYARREDAIIHALEIENERLRRDDVNICGDHDCSARESPATSHSGEENGDMTDDVSLSEENSDSALELSQSGISFEEPNHISSSKLQSVQGRRKRTPYDSEDDGIEGVKRMRGLQDLGIGVVSKRSVHTVGLLEIVQHDSTAVIDTQNGMPNGCLANGSKTSSLRRKRSQVATANEILKRKNRSRPLTKVLESTEMVSIPVVGDQLPNSSGSSLQLCDGKVPELEADESKRSLSMDHTGVSRDNDASTDAPEQATVSSSINQMKENSIIGKSELLENGSSKRLFDLRRVGEEKRSSGNSAVLAPCSSGRPEIGAVARQSSRSSQVEAASLRNERFNESGPTSSAVVHDVDQSIEKGSSKWQLKGKRNSRQTSRDRKHNSRKYMNVDDLSNTSLADIRRSDVLCHVTDLKRNCNGISRSAAYNYTIQGKSKQVAELSDGPIQRSLPFRQSRSIVPARYQTSDIARNTCSDGSLYDVKVDVKAKYRPQRVPLVSLMSKLNGKPIVGHPLTVKALDDDYSDKLFGSTGCDLRGGKLGCAVQQNAQSGRIPIKHLGSPKKSPKTKKSGLLPKKIRKLSSLTGHRQSEDRKQLVEKSRGPVIACVPLTLVFSRINEAVNGLARPTHRVLKSSET